MSKYQVIIKGHGRGKVFKDGEEIHGVTQVEVRAGVDELTTIKLTLIADEVDLTSDIPEEDQDG
jgi:hypothetical protein